MTLVHLPWEFEESIGELPMPSFDRPRWLVCCLALVSLPVAACSYGPSAVNQPTINASHASSLAIETYDKNGDGIVSGDELDQAPALKAALQRLDTDGDKAITADEVMARVKVWQGMRTGLTSFEFAATMDGSPLTEATVTFEPEGFLGDQIKAATATTNVYGRGMATIPKDQRPDPTWPPGMHIALYRVKISKVVNGKETIPAKYNTNTILGQEAALDVAEIANRHVVYALSSK